MLAAKRNDEPAINRDTGHPPPVIDTLFAATALELDRCFVTRNLSDVAETGAQLFSPWEVG